MKESHSIEALPFVFSLLFTHSQKILLLFSSPPCFLPHDSRIVADRALAIERRGGELGSQVTMTLSASDGFALHHAAAYLHNISNVLCMRISGCVLKEKYFIY